MLRCAVRLRHSSRMACEVLVTPELSGMTIIIPEPDALRETEI